MIYVRSRRPLLTVGVVAVAFALGFGLLGILATELPSGWLAAAALWAGCLAGSAVAAWSGWNLRSWPKGKLAFFRDRLVVLKGRSEMGALWEQMESVTLADGSGWPEIKITDCVTILLRRNVPIRFKPAEFGLDPEGCRDLIFRLRDEPELRERLPVFDSDRDLAATPLVAGETADPKF